MNEPTEQPGMWPPKPAGPNGPPRPTLEGYSTLVPRVSTIAILVWGGFGIDALSVLGTAISVHQPRAATLASALGVLYSLIYLVTAFVYFVWLAQAVRNCNAIWQSGRTIVPAGAVIEYFVPILNLFRPYKTMRAIADRSNVDEDMVGLAAMRRQVGWWWALWIGTIILGFAVLGITFSDPTNVSMQAYAGMVGLLADVPMCLVFVRMIGMLSRAQQSRYELLRGVNTFSGVGGA
ncbi:MAG TPA: DUF4328 domain-containing protein [Capsulimonadaceae bacterium]|jgi:hypothetical protein